MRLLLKSIIVYSSFYIFYIFNYICSKNTNPLVNNKFKISINKNEFSK